MKLDKLVAALIRDHVGGERFFDNLDKAVQKQAFMDALFYELFHEDNENELQILDPVIVVSGTFGQYFTNWLRHEAQEDMYDVLQVEGGLRHTQETKALEPFEDLIRDRKVVFFDDSYYSGTTEGAVKDAIEAAGGELVRTYVVYDGSRNNSGIVRSLFRYHDHY